MRLTANFLVGGLLALSLFVAANADTGVAIPSQITNAFNGPCDWPYQYYTDAQITSAPLNISQSVLSCSKTSAQFYFATTDCGQPWQKFATIFNGNCFSVYTSYGNLTTNSLDYFLQSVDALVLVACGSDGGWLATPVPQQMFEVGGFTVTINNMADILGDVDIALKVAARIFNIFGESGIANALNSFETDVTGPLQEEAENLGKDLKEACSEVTGGGVLYGIHKLLKYREKFATVIGYMNDLFTALTFFNCEFDHIFYSLAEINALVIRPTTKCQNAPGFNDTLDPTHCAANQPATGRRRRLLRRATPQAAAWAAGYSHDQASTLSEEDAQGLAGALSDADAKWEDEQLADLASNPAARKLTQQTLLTCTAMTKINALASNLQTVGTVITNFRDIVNAQYTAAAAQLAGIIANIKSQINSFLDPFTPIKSIIDSVVSVLENIQCPDFLSFLCDLGSIVTDAINFIMTSLGLQPLDVYINDLLSQLKPLFPNFVPDLTVLKNLANTLINDVESRITTLGTMLVQDFKPALDLNYWLDPFVNITVIASPPVYLTRTLGTAGSVTFSCSSNAYPIVLKAVRHYAGCGSDLSSALRYPCKRASSCTINYAPYDTVCSSTTVNTGYYFNNTIAQELLAELELQVFPGIDSLLSYVYCVDQNSPFGPLPQMLTATASYNVVYDGGWWGNETSPTGYPSSTIVTRGTKIHSAVPQLVASYQDGTTSTNGFNCGARELLVNSVTAQPSLATTTSPAASDPCHTNWISATTDVPASFASTIPAGTVWSSTQLWGMLKQELCFFKFYSTFSSASPAPWTTDPTAITYGSSYNAATNSYTKVPYLGLGGMTVINQARSYCAPYYTPGATQSQYCTGSTNGTASGTFSYIDAVYGASDMESNYLCNGLSHGGSVMEVKICINKLGTLLLNGWLGFTPGTSDGVGSMSTAAQAYCTAAQASGGSNGCASIFCQGDLSQTAKADWKTMCSSNYTMTPAGSNWVPVPGYWNNNFTNPTPAQDKAFRVAHRALRQAVLTSYTAAGTAPSTYSTACNTTVFANCQGQKTCSTGSCVPKSVQFACVEPSHFAVRAPQYEVLLFGDAVAGSTGYATTLTCPSAGSQVAVLTGAGWGVSNNFGLTDITSQLYGNCQGSSCSFDVSQIATLIGQSMTGLYVKISLKCACGAGFESQPLNAQKPTAVVCKACTAGKYRSATMAACQPCPFGYVTNTTGATVCTPCPAGTFANITGGTNCTLCPAGTASAITGAGTSSICTPCAQNTFAKLNGSTACTACNPGYFTNGTGTAHNCTACPAGTKRAASDSSCVTCPVGTYSTLASASCSNAPAGSCQATVSSSLFEPCEGGTYASTAGQAECSSCPNGTFTSKSYGSISSSTCVTYTAVDWIAESVKFAASKGVKSMAYNAQLCSAFIQAKTNSTTGLKQLNNSLCNYGPYNVQFCNWDGGDCCPGSCNTGAGQYIDPKTNKTTIVDNACNPRFMMCYNSAANTSTTTGRRRLLRVQADAAEPDTDCKVWNPPATTPAPTGATCDPSDPRLGNGACDNDLNIAACGFDKGDCCPGSCALNRNIPSSCSASSMNCRDPAFAGQNKDTHAPRLYDKMGQLVFHSDRLPARNVAFKLPAADNDPCWDGLADATITSGPSTTTCGSADSQESYRQKVDLSAVDPSGNTITSTGDIIVVDSTPPRITNTIFKPNAALRGELQELGQVNLGCITGNVVGCAQRDPAVRRAGVAISVYRDTAAVTRYLSRALTIKATDNHPCFSSSSVTLATFKNLNAAQVGSQLDLIGAAQTQRTQAVSVASKAGGGCAIRLYTATDPAGNIDRVADVACAQKVK